MKSQVNLNSVYLKRFQPQTMLNFFKGKFKYNDAVFTLSEAVRVG